MAKSNSDVAAGLFNRPVSARTKRPVAALIGSNFRVEFRDGFDVNVSGFVSQAAVYSYSTLVALLVHNHNVVDSETGTNTNTPKSELWATRRRYSSTTDRQMMELLGAWRNFNRDNAGKAERQVSLYRVKFDDTVLINRLAPINLVIALKHATTLRNRVDLPKLHEHTRRLSVDMAITQLEEAIELVRKDVPESVLANFADTPELLATALSMHSQLVDMRDLPLNELRITARAIAALEKN